MESIKVVLDVLERKINSLTTNSPLHLIAYLPIRDFWFTAFGYKQVVSLHRLSQAMLDYARTRKSVFVHFLLFSFVYTVIINIICLFVCLFVCFYCMHYIPSTVDNSTTSSYSNEYKTINADATSFEDRHAMDSIRATQIVMEFTKALIPLASHTATTKRATKSHTFVPSNVFSALTSRSQQQDRDDSPLLFADKIPIDVLTVSNLFCSIPSDTEFFIAVEKVLQTAESVVRCQLPPPLHQEGEVTWESISVRCV